MPRLEGDESRAAENCCKEIRNVSGSPILSLLTEYFEVCLAHDT